MSILHLTLSGPMQSWGTVQGRFTMRDTAAFPTKSGVIGLIANAMGRTHDQPVDDLNALRILTVATRPGVIMEDYQTVCATKTNLVTRRAYLCDAVFDVYLEGDGTTLAKVRDALERPARPIWLGRAGCPPDRPPIDHRDDRIMDGRLEDVDTGGCAWRMDARAGETDARMTFDVPVSFDRRGREWRGRMTTTGPADDDIAALAFTSAWSQL